MKNAPKIAAVGAIAALGLATGAVAQQNHAQQRPMNAAQHQQMSGGMMGNGQMMGMMMNDPKMRQQMSDMMAGCNKMMMQMGSMPGMHQKPKG